MENDQEPATGTSDETPAEPTDSAAQDGPGAMITLPLGGKCLREKNGRFKSPNLKAKNQNGRKHGMRAINQAWRDKLPLDHSRKAGKVEQQVFQELVMAFGGGDTANIDVITQIRIQMVAYDAGRCFQHKESKIMAFKKLKEEAERRGQTLSAEPHPKFLHALDGYEQPTINSLRAGLDALGKPPDKSVPRLQDILDSIAAGENEQPGDEK